MAHKRVFIADDEPEFRSVVAEIASRDGWAISECETGIDLLRELAASDDDGLIILDLLMPEMDGIEALSRLNNLTHKRPVCLVTGGPDANAIAATLLCYARGIEVCGSFGKPTSLQALADVLNGWVPKSPSG